MERTWSKYQQDIFADVANGDGHTVVEARAGTGKCLGKGTPVMRYDGTVVPVEEVQAGDQLMGPDSAPRFVRSVARGHGRLCRVRPIKGAPWICNLDHVLTLVGSNHHAGEVRDVSVRDLFNETLGLPRMDKEWKLARAPVRAFGGELLPLPVAPYLLGLWLGDGTRGEMQITNSEPEIRAYCNAVAEHYGHGLIERYDPRGHTYNLRFRMGPRGVAGRNTPSVLRRTFRSCENDQGKCIPWYYLRASEADRRELLAGIVDTDGYLNSGIWEIAFASEHLCEQVAFLARSLGLAAYWRGKDVRLAGWDCAKRYWRLCISGELSSIPCKVARRVAVPRKQRKDVLRTGFDIEILEDGDFYGFTLSGDGRFILGDFTVTHNTTTIVEALKHLPTGSRAMLTAFNKSIATELAQRAPSHVRVATLHSHGLAAVQHALGKVKVEEGKARRLLLERWPDSKGKLRAAAIRLASLAKANLLPDTPGNEHAELEWLLRRNWIFDGDPDENEAVVTMAAHLLVIGKDVAACGGTIDFDDMVWLPAVLGMSLRRTERLFTDECLPAWTPVLLADGSSMAIGDIVNDRREVDVLAFDTASGKQRTCRVVGWRKLLNQKPLVKIRARWNGWKRTKLGKCRPTNFVVCTIDHKVFTTDGWIAAGDVKPGMIVQIETSAEKSQHGKITTCGRATLSKVMSAKNVLGVGRGHNRTSTIAERGGNGRGPTLPERVLRDALGDGWVVNHAVATKALRSDGCGYPSCYKVDIANPTLMIAIEVDGGSHNNPLQKTRDAKKQHALQQLGWRVFHFANRAAVQKPFECAAAVAASVLCYGTDCPIDAVVTSVEPVAIPDYHVYDISVEDCHCFYANGILVHNCQDLSPVQHWLVSNSILRGGRLCAIGDSFQAIYQFRGAAQNSMQLLRDRFAARTMPLSITYRCPSSVVALVHDIVPDFEAAPDCPVGLVADATTETMLAKAAPGDFILSRVNAPLVRYCLELLALGKRATILGRNIGRSICSLIDKSEAATAADLVAFAHDWCVQEAERILSRDPDADVGHLFDRRDCLVAIAGGLTTIEDVKRRAEHLFEDGDPIDRITLASTHRAKGLERERVWMLRWTYLRGQSQAERNLFYVAATRTKRELYIVREDV